MPGSTDYGAAFEHFIFMELHRGQAWSQAQARLDGRAPHAPAGVPEDRTAGGPRLPGEGQARRGWRRGAAGDDLPRGAARGEGRLTRRSWQGFLRIGPSAAAAGEGERGYWFATCTSTTPARPSRRLKICGPAKTLSRTAPLWMPPAVRRSRRVFPVTGSSAPGAALSLGQAWFAVRFAQIRWL